MEECLHFESGNFFVENLELEQQLELLNDELKDINMDLIRKKCLLEVLRITGIEGTTDNERIALYEKSLSVSENGYHIVHKRDVDEIYINNYISEWIKHQNANMDLQLCLDFYAIITYISDYYGKDDSGTMKFIKEALKNAHN